MAPPARLRDRTAASAAPPTRAAVPQQAGTRRDTGMHPGPAARYRYDRRTGSWWWSPEMFAVLGTCPDDAEPGTAALLRQHHPDDRPRVLAVLAAASEERRAFALETRVLRPDGTRRAVVLVGEPSVDGEGRVVAVDGICVDITDGRPPAPPADRVQQLEAEVDQLHSAMASRAAIEQAKGILMLLTSCGDQAAFDLLVHISSHTHRKVRDVALAITSSAADGTRLPDDVRGIIRDACPPARLR